ncbi:hypothetical protein [Streptomyces sp. NPDC001978]|uniref:SLAC1 family transporter n=1 Tax=Streptomyces sp. NPDC001978 TaxID=3364627 RepID=UPI0036B0B497
MESVDTNMMGREAAGTPGALRHTTAGVPQAGTALASGGPAAPGPRAQSIGLMSVSLGTAGLGGAWQSASATISPPLWVSDVLYVAAGLVWVVLLGRYLWHGGGRWRNVLDDLHHPGQGFTLAYVPIVAMLTAGHFSRFGLDGARWVYILSGAAAGVIAARLLAHWVTGGLGSAPLHPGYTLPVVSGPFIASATASTLRLPELAAAAFAVGILYWLAFGTVVLGSLLISGDRMPAPARPTLTILVIPPATGGLAWTAAHHGQVDTIGYGFAGLLLFTLVVIGFLFPHLRQRAFHFGYWIFSFPMATGANFLLRWLAGTQIPGRQALSWVLLAAASVVFVLLCALTVGHALASRTRARTAG